MDTITLKVSADSLEFGEFCTVSVESIACCYPYSLKMDTSCTTVHGVVINEKGLCT